MRVRVLKRIGLGEDSISQNRHFPMKLHSLTQMTLKTKYAKQQQK